MISLYKAAALGLAVTLLLAGCSSRVETAPSEAPEIELTSPSISEPPPEPEPEPESAAVDGSFEAATAEVNLALPEQLMIARPESETLEIAAENYYITGSSDPEQDLLLNGEAVETRGQHGTFAVFMPLKLGENTFTFEQEGESRVITITRIPGEEYSLTDSATRMRPEINAAARAGEGYALSCVAPSGAEVIAAVGGKEIALEQNAATAVEGVPATFSGTFEPDDVDGTVDLGPVVYTLHYSGKSTDFVSAGNLYVVGTAATLVVHAVNTAATLFTEDSQESVYDSMLVKGATDSVTEIGSGMYRLSMGRWVMKDAVEILTGQADVQNSVQEYSVKSHGKYETLTLTGTAPAPCLAQWGGEQHSITLFHTAIADSISTDGSELLSAIEVAAEDGNTALHFQPKEGVALGGYLVEYDGNNTVITWRAAPKPPEGGLPLAGITILLDPGHGGSDIGARGALWNSGPLEKDINLAAGLVARRYLQSLGAEVLMTREADTRSDMNDVIRMMRNPEVDFAVSLHCNSVEPYYDGTAALGTETHYFDPNAADFAERLVNLVCETTGRKNRTAKHSYYRMTLSTGAPVVLLEMGFATNPVEYDSLCSKENLYATAEMIAQAILATLEA